jgi:hypothetical protein
MKCPLNIWYKFDDKIVQRGDASRTILKKQKVHSFESEHEGS